MSQKQNPREQALAEVAGAFGQAPLAVAWLRRRLEIAQAVPSYQPGYTFDVTAYNEGRKAALADIIKAIETALPGVGNIR